ncbi:hypothetical protein [Haliscomenobacter sp.]|uniref:hypothetical protein n=1 Tax=Haliscomenobacter sp. TaxID=2717303 RepID=UPI003364E99E
MNRFEQLIEYVINDEDAKARELFHDIVVAKSREIYENLMQEEAEEDLDESAEEELDESDEEDLEEGAMGGDASNDLIDNIEADEEQDMNMEGEDMDDMDDMDDGDMADDMGDDDMGSSEPASKDDILNLEDKLDQLMAEFEDLMGGDDMGDGDGFGPEEGGDAIEMDDSGEMQPGMMEAISLKAAPKPVTSEEGGVNKRSTVSANSGAKGPIGSTVKPVHAGGEGGGKHDAAGAYSNQTKDLIGDFQNKAGASMKGQKPATKPHLAQATGVNTKSPVARS